MRTEATVRGRKRDFRPVVPGNQTPVAPPCRPNVARNSENPNMDNLPPPPQPRRVEGEKRGGGALGGRGWRLAPEKFPNGGE